MATIIGPMRRIARIATTAVVTVTLLVTVSQASAQVRRFPATTPAQVLALATKQLTTGFGAWSVRSADGPAYRVEYAQRGSRTRLHVLRASGELWIGTALPGYVFSCEGPAGTAVCRDADPAGEDGMAEAFYDAFGFFAPDYLHLWFDPILKRGHVTQARHQGRPVSCLTGRRPVGTLKLCVTRFAFPSLLVIGTDLRVTATKLRPNVAASELEQPAGDDSRDS